MQTKTMGLIVTLSLVMTSLACAQEEKQDQGAKQAQGEEQNQGEALSEVEKHDEEAKGHSHESCELHGGSVVMTPSHHFEVVFAREEVRVYGYDGAQKPINEMKDATGTVTLQAKDGSGKELALSYVSPDAEAGQSQGYFAAPHEFGEIEEGQMKATVMLSGVGEESITFKTAVKPSDLLTYACPMHPDIMGEDPIACSECGMALTKQANDEDGDPEKSEHDHQGHDH
jgi:hypothetical protein